MEIVFLKNDFGINFLKNNFEIVLEKNDFEIVFVKTISKSFLKNKTISKSFLQIGMKIAFEKNGINGEDSSHDDVASDVDSTPTWPSTTAHSTSTGLDMTNMGYTGLI